MRVEICMFTYNRLPHLRMCLGYLLNHLVGLDDDDIFDVIVYDDCSTDDTPKFLKRAPVKVRRIKSKHPRSPSGMEKRLGNLRRHAVSQFLESSDNEFLILLDDDIMLGGPMIYRAVWDYNKLDKITGMNPGALTFHSMFGHSSFVQACGNVFANVSFSGEANMLFRRDHLEEVGNHFGDGEKQFGDEQIRATRRAGRKVYTRVHPPYKVQHIGIGTGGSKIWARKARQPRWVRHPYRCVYKVGKGQIIKIPDFDIQYYMSLLGSVDPAEAPSVYMKQKGEPW